MIDPLLPLLRHETPMTAELVPLAETEIKRLRTNGPRGILAETDHVSKIHCQTLERALAEFKGIV